MSITTVWDLADEPIYDNGEFESSNESEAHASEAPEADVTDGFEPCEGAMAPEAGVTNGFEPLGGAMAMPMRPLPPLPPLACEETIPMMPLPRFLTTEL